MLPRGIVYPDPPLADAVVALRPWESSDLACVEHASRDPAIPESTTVPARYTEAEGVAWIERQWSRAENGEGLSLAIAKAGKDEAVGAVVLLSRPTPGSAAIGYWIIQRERGQGYASHAVRLLSTWALTAAGFARVEALVEPGNAASQRLLERAAFRREGHLRSYLAFNTRRADAIIYSLPDDVSTPE
jgi:ribosomal-protein-alanine N-acetyltransferase